MSKHWVTRYLAEPEASAVCYSVRQAMRVVAAIANTTIGDAVTLTTRIAIVLTPLVWVILGVKNG